MRRHCLTTYRRPAARSTRLMAALVIAGLVALPSAAVAIDERLGAGLPLVLKDGRIANVTVHTIPFATGADVPDAATAASLEATFRPLATDCFLTAQAIGHVAPGITRDGDTLAAHRLARARADGIQGVLAGFGMPQPAVASVWDWQFLVQESQVTLWVFSLNVGDDCDGTPLPIETPALTVEAPTAETSSAQTPTAQAPTESPAPATAGAAPGARTTADAPPSASSTGPVAELAETPGEATSRAFAEAAKGQAQLADLSANGTTPPLAPPAVAATASPSGSNETPVAATGATQPPREPAERPASARDPLATAAVAPAATARSALAGLAATTSQSASGAEAGAATAEATAADAPATLVASVDTEAVPPADDIAAPALVITFDVNSSYFPAGAGPQLRAFLDSLPKAAPLQLEVAAAVGTGAVRGVSAEEAARYNAWMADRRAQRVAEWLEANARDRPITVNERLVENDPSREVRLHATLVR